VGKDEQTHAYCQKVKSNLNKLAYLIFIVPFVISGCAYLPVVNIGNVFLKQENYSEAEKYYKRALSMDPYNLEAANNLASLYLIVGKDYQKALMNLITAVAFNKGFPAYAMDTIGVLYHRLGNVEKAKFFLTKACENAGDDIELRHEVDQHLKDSGETGCKKE
jgi:tetratricopeptide (TPR) repeat protein